LFDKLLRRVDRYVLCGAVLLGVVNLAYTQSPFAIAPTAPAATSGSVKDQTLQSNTGQLLPPVLANITQTAAQTLQPDAANMAAPGGTQREWSGSGQKPRELKTPWETVPAGTAPYPRPGNFYIAPSGPGAYTLLDAFLGRESQNRPQNPYLQFGQNPNPFFNMSFGYLDDPQRTEYDLSAPLKRIHLGDNWLLSFGGEFRDRYAYEENARLYNVKPLAGSTNSYDLFRARIYTDLWYKDVFRIYAEYISADSSNQAIPPSSSDINRNDILNLFLELKIWAINGEGVYVRAGRQELLFGSQRLISPSDWSNTMRTFQGVRLYYHGEKVETDAFWVQPVIVNPDKFDSVDDKQVFAGSWLKYRLNKDVSVDAYYLYLDNDNRTFKGNGGVLGGYDVNTIGGRFVGENNQFLWDFEGALQFGNYSNQTDFGRMCAVGIGYWFKNVPTSPTLWLYYDYASGDQNPGTGNVHQTFNQLFPFGHQYFGSMDVIGRQNINDIHLDLGLFPADWLRLTAGYHILTLDSAKDALYNGSGSVVRQDTTGNSGINVGNLISATALFHIDNHQTLSLNYGHLFAGTFIRDTAVNAAARRDMDSFWVQYAFKW
jgi:hypothetical protein